MSILIDKDTTFIVQGITGREAVNLTRECLDYGVGAKILGKYGIEFRDRSTSMWEAAGEAVEKIQGAAQ